MNASWPSSCTLAQKMSNFGRDRLSPLTCPPMATARAPSRFVASSSIVTAISGNCNGIEAIATNRSGCWPHHDASVSLCLLQIARASPWSLTSHHQKSLTLTASRSTPSLSIAAMRSSSPGPVARSFSYGVPFTTSPSGISQCACTSSTLTRLPAMLPCRRTADGCARMVRSPTYSATVAPATVLKNSRRFDTALSLNCRVSNDVLRRTTALQGGLAALDYHLIRLQCDARRPLREHASDAPRDFHRSRLRRFSLRMDSTDCGGHRMIEFPGPPRPSRGVPPVRDVRRHGVETGARPLAEEMYDDVCVDQPADLVADANTSILHDDVDGSRGRTAVVQQTAEHRKQCPELFVHGIGIEAIGNHELCVWFAIWIEPRNHQGVVVTQLLAERWMRQVFITGPCGGSNANAPRTRVPHHSILERGIQRAPCVL